MKPLEQKRIRPKIAWVGAGLILAAAILHTWLQPPWIAPLTRPAQAVLWLSLLALYGSGAAAWDWVSALKRRQDRLAGEAGQARLLVEKAYQRLEAIFQISQKFIDASDEKEIVDLLLRFSVELAGAAGASYVPLDEHGQPMAALNRGELPFPMMNDWVEYLASPTVRDRCRACKSHDSLATSCPLLKGPAAGALGMFCLPLRRGEREFGVLNLYLQNVDQVDPQTQTFLHALVDETALSLDGVRLRRRELTALRQMQEVREKTDLGVLLKSLLANVHHTMEADFTVVVIARPGGTQPPRLYLEQRDFPGPARPFLDGLLQGVMGSAEPLMLGDVAGGPDSPNGIRSLAATPLLSLDHHAQGALLVGSRKASAFHQRQLILLQTFAGQMGLMVQNADLLAELEYKTLIAERTRLAREIHDGLAQTLGFLKLQVTQMRGALDRREYDRLRETIQQCHAVLSDAYQDTRQAIDGLRIWPDEAGLKGWILQTVREFSELCDLPVRLEEGEVKAELAPEIHAQLIRIVQEALHNVRKHARASQIWIAWFEAEGDLWLEVRDNGVGFEPDEVSEISRHGLRGMRERAELIGADFQVISKPDRGATVRIRLPLVEVAS